MSTGVKLGINERMDFVLYIPPGTVACLYPNRSTWWRHQMETFSALLALALCAGNSPVPVNSLHKGQWRGALMFSLICAWINDWVNNREAGDLRRHRGHYDVICNDHMLLSSRSMFLFLYRLYHTRVNKRHEAVVRSESDRIWMLVILQGPKKFVW